MFDGNPFKILLDAYQDESEAFFYSVTEDLSEFRENKLILLDRKLELKKAAFAYLCMDYIVDVGNYSAHEDFPLFAKEMGYDDEINDWYYLFGVEGIEWNEADADEYGYTAFETMLEELILKYKEEWGAYFKGKFGINI